jgi:hypothetical protein
MQLSDPSLENTSPLSPSRRRSYIFFKKRETVFLLSLYIAILGVAIGIKYAYHTFDAEQSFFDTKSYVAVADLPITSRGFWAGVRPFTVPLFYKLLGVNTGNYSEPAVMQRISWVQSGLSLLSWVVLGLVIGSKARNRWWGAIVFGMVMAFSLIYEISRWDLTLLSESLAFSFFALTLAGWLGLLSVPVSWRKSLPAYLLLTGVIVSTILFSFTRDVNAYILVMVAVIVTVISLFKRSALPINLTLAYLAAVLLIFITQTASSNISNRWQIYLYDQFALRFIDTPGLVDYFTRAGMPISPLLYKPPDMHDSVYQNLLGQDPRLEAFRQWMSQHGKATYLGYLLTHPKTTLSQPLVNASEIFAGTATETLYESGTDWYRNPMHPNEFIPRYIRGLTKLIFPRLPLWAIVSIYFGQVVLTAWALFRRWNIAPWLIVGIFVISTYPLMVLIWQAEPLEISRHALPVAIDFHLASWLALAFLMDHLFEVWARKLKGSPVAFR